METRFVLRRLCCLTLALMLGAVQAARTEAQERRAFRWYDALWTSLVREDVLEGPLPVSADAAAAIYFLEDISWMHRALLDNSIASIPVKATEEAPEEAASEVIGHEALHQQLDVLLASRESIGSRPPFARFDAAGEAVSASEQAEWDDGGEAPAFLLHVYAWNGVGFEQFAFSEGALMHISNAEAAFMDAAGRVFALREGEGSLTVTAMHQLQSVDGLIAYAADDQPWQGHFVHTMTEDGALITQLQASGETEAAVLDLRADSAFLPEGRQCAACGQALDNGENHAPVASISRFCREQHYACTDPMHHCRVEEGGCGLDYPCRNADAHAVCLQCGDPWCSRKRGGHETPCGKPSHRPCQVQRQGVYVQAEHERCGGDSGCGAWRCDGREHTAADCGHCPQRSGNHGFCPLCRHYVCQTDGAHGTDANQCSAILCEAGCGAVLESVDAHRLTCGGSGAPHYACDGQAHTACDLGCGGMHCDGTSHGTGAEQCSTIYCEAGCGAVLESVDAHRLTCGGSGTPHYACDGQTHTACGFGCGGMHCDGNAHGTGAEQCSTIYCEADCGAVLERLDAHRLQCGTKFHTHYSCDGKRHRACPYHCGGMLCDGADHGTGADQCTPWPFDE